jgi:hydroxymethylpyrimidine pyrophosphatase-like HAD family hydrolase
MMVMSDPYLDDSVAIERLYNEWKKYGKIFLALDFDDTIYDFHKKGYKYEKVIELVKACQKQGCYTIIFTGSELEKYPFIRSYCEEIGLHIDKINENAIPMNVGNNGKIYYNILLDDRSGLSSSFRILKGALELMVLDKGLTV